MGDHARENRMKRCANCEETLPVEVFTADVRRPDGRCPYCKVCAQMRGFLYYRRNRIELIEQMKEYAARRPEVNRAAHARYRASSKGKETKRAWGLRRKPEERREEYLGNRETILRRSRQWRADHPGATWLQVQSWAARNPEAYKASELNRRARRAGATKRLDAGAVSALLVKQSHGCAYCRQALVKFHVDHILPLSRGGEHVIENLALACPACNLRKNSKTAEEFLKDFPQQA